MTAESPREPATAPRRPVKTLYIQKSPQALHIEVDILTILNATELSRIVALEIGENRFFAGRGTVTNYAASNAQKGMWR